METSLTFSVEKDHVGVHAPSDFLCEKLGGIPHHFHGKILDGAAGLAHKMVMGRRPEIKMLGTVPAGKTGDFPELRQQVQIPVDGAKADVGKLFPHRQIQGICGGMVGAVHQAVLDGFPLPALF